MEAKFRLNLYFFHFEFDITRIVGALRVLWPFNIFLLPAMTASYAAAGYIVWHQLSANAEKEVMETAHLMIEGGLAARNYTTQEVAPALETLKKEQAKLEDGVQVLDVQIPAVLQKAMAGLPRARKQILHSALHEIHDIARQLQNDLPERQFFPQSIPFHAATKEFDYFKAQYPHFEYAEAALNPTNPEDRTTGWQADIVKHFRDNPSEPEFAHTRITPFGPSYILSSSIRAESSCLRCHGRAEDAPPELVKLYGSDNGFGWRLNDVIGAQIVSVPVEVAHNRAVSAMKTVSIWLGGIFLGLYVIVNVIALAFMSPRLTARTAP